MARSPQEVFAHPGGAPAAVDLGGIVAADSARNRVDDGVDTFVFRDGVIRAQTVRYAPQPKG
ncbi:MAG: hypothetical protein ACLQIK_13970 [Mycobacterium sp.]|uniref:hypothetical protein n=1 Tax=Mycobacterium sp. TaxID=1785 RepID=UPI002847D657|nr:hypothetical protein [Mycobacterium sp.]HKI41619.1 hypothetical protein [Mycobacterium sp.]